MHRTHSIRGIALMACLSCLGCTPKKILPPPTPIPRVRPTAERPIVLNRLDRGGRPPLGGGSRIAGCLSYNNLIAASVSYDKRTDARWVTFYDYSRSVTKNVMLPLAPKQTVVHRMSTYMEILLSDQGEAVVTITRTVISKDTLTKKMRDAQTVERYYVLSDGTVKKIEADKDEQITYQFPTSGGIVMLRTSGERHLVRPWRIERYDHGLKLRWKKEVNAYVLSSGGTAKHDFSLQTGREIRHFRKDGTWEVEQLTHD